MDSRLTAERVRELLEYNPETGVFRWRVRRSTNCPAGNVAGTRKTNGYLQISIDDRLYTAHRLAWLYVHGRWPEGVIDHINRVRDDNRISNLRDADAFLNTQNRGADRSKKTTPLLGVTKDRRTRRWKSSITARHKVYRLGQFDTAEQAHAAYLAAKQVLHGRKS